MSIAPLVSSLGIAQIVSWGTLYYAIGVLGPPMARDLGVSESFLFGAFTAGLIVSGTLSPFVGRLVDRRGGRFVLAWGSVLGAVSLAVLAIAMNPVVLVAGWLMAGAAISFCLYDPAFATLSQHTGASFRKAVTALTLFGGFASTVFWPLSHVLMSAYGWRASFAIYAGLHVLLCLPIHLVFIPREWSSQHAPEARSGPLHAPGLGYLAMAFAAAAFVSAVVAVHFVGLMAAKGLTQAEAIALGMLIGPAQVAGRIAEFGFGGRLPAVRLAYIAFGLLLGSMVCLLVAGGMGVAAVAFVVAYGVGNGVFTIVRGTVPAPLYGRERIGALLGTLARVGQYSRAIAPAVFSGVLALGLTRDMATGLLAALLGIAIAAYARAARTARGGDNSKD